MRYFLRELNSSRWTEISYLTALTMIRANEFWDDADWDKDMLEIPNLITLREQELLVIGYQGQQPLEGYKNLREDEYYRIAGEDLRDPQTDLAEVLMGGWRDTMEIVRKERERLKKREIDRKQRKKWWE